MTPKQKDDFAPLTAEEQRTVDAIYDGNAAKVLPSRSGQFYSFSPAASVIENRSSELWKDAGMDSAAVRQLSETVRALENLVPETLAAVIAERHVDGLLAAARVSDDPDADERALDKRIAEWNGQVREQLAATYGAHEAEHLLDRTVRFVRQQPALAKLLQQHGNGSRPEIVLPLAQHVFSTGWR